jgi:hypothetical protein
MFDLLRNAAEALDAVKQQFLGLQGLALSLQVDSLPDNWRFPDGFVLPQPDRGSVIGFTVIAPPEPFTTIDVLPPQLQALAEEHGSGSRDCYRVIPPRSYYFTLWDPHDYDKPNAQSKQLERARELRDRFLRIAHAAGRAIASVSLSRLTWVDARTVLASRREREAAGLWAKMVFDLAWQKRSGTTLSAERKRIFVRADHSHERFEFRYEDTATALRQWLNTTKPHPRIEKPLRDILKFYGDSLPDAFTSIIDDIVAASVLAAETLAAELRLLAGNIQQMPAWLGADGEIGLVPLEHRRKGRKADDLDLLVEPAVGEQE